VITAEEQELITIVALCTLKPEHVTEFQQIARDLIGASRAESGNVSYDLYADLDNPSRFTFIEVWKDRKAIEIHNASPHFRSFAEAAGPLFAGSLDVRKYRTA
jgi:quinol monooxygenase YgiN